MAARSLRDRGGRLHAFTQLAAPPPGLALHDEDRFVDAVLSQESDIRWQPVPLLLSAANPDADIPLFGPLAIAEDRCCAAAAAGGARLMLSGSGGDEAASYNGAQPYLSLMIDRRWRRAMTELALRARREGQPLANALVRRLVRPWLHRLGLRRRRRGLSALRFLAPDVAAQVRAEMAARIAPQNRPEDRIALLAEGHLAGRNDRWSIIGARHGIAFTYPLLDRRVVDFCLSLPLDRLLSEGYARQPFRAAMHGLLPETIRWRDSKFSPYPDRPLALAAAKTGLLARLDAVRTNGMAAQWFDLDRIGQALRAIAEGSEADGMAAGLGGAGGEPARLRDAMEALRALILAEYAARG